ncbi:MAG: hypothetical protein U0527_03030 [Candidatus Eisenbacteria bacterium]
MKEKLIALVLASLGVAATSADIRASEPGGAEINSAIGTAFAYQGQLKLNGQPVSGPTDFQFFLYDGLSAGSQVGPTLSFSNLDVSNGVFSASLDFGKVFVGDARWLETWVRYPAGTGNWTILSPRQPVAAVPYAMGLVPGATIDGNGTIANPLLVVNNHNSSGVGVQISGGKWGLQADVQGTATGVWAQSFNGTGVIGVNAFGGAAGVFGLSNSDDGVLGQGGVGVHGLGGSKEGVLGEASHSQHAGVTGIHHGVGWGVLGEATDAGSEGVRGYATVPGAIGVRALHINGGTALLAEGTHAIQAIGWDNGIEASGQTTAVHGSASSTSGTGIFGEVNGANAVAVRGDNPDPSGRAGLFNGRVDVLGAPLSLGAQTRQMINLYADAYGIGVQPYTHYSRTDYGGGFAWYQGGVHTDTAGDPGAGGARLMYTDGNGRLETRNGIWAKGLGNAFTPLFVTGLSDSDVEFKVTNVGEVFADGTFHSGGADFAELLPAKRGLEPGDVLVISEDGRLEKSRSPYQTNVVGVYSTQPGYMGGSTGESEEGKVPLAVVGVVPIKVTDEGGRIVPGDLLTTSSKQGRAMKAQPELTASGRESYPSGAIIGKALTGLKSGEGTVTVLLVAK